MSTANTVTRDVKKNSISCRTFTKFVMLKAIGSDKSFCHAGLFK